ncbi:MAG: Z1 domain-containing protein [Acidobacteria bacterium]|nr:Z1 domain-containing protein [Acidobacteriota bacterium]
MFADDGDLREPMVEVVGDYLSHLPLNHKADHPVTLPPTLLTAVRVFVLTRAIRILRGQGRQHCTMMINVSRFNAIQEKVHGEVYIYLQTLQNAAAMALGPDPLSDPVIAEFKEDFEREFGDGEETFDAVRTVLAEAARAQPLTVNMKGGVLDYRAHRENGLHVIAIGGLALSRGLTLEGLTVSYILRNTAASDTLMQMARWFGYRPGYEDMCRVYLPQLALNHYREINGAIEELRDEVRRMHDLGMTPEYFGLKVRESPTAIRITAANKMRTATQMTIAQDYSERHLEGYILPNNPDVNQANLDAARAFVATLGEPSSAKSTKQADVWECQSGHSVMSLLKAFRFSPAHGDLGPISGDVSLFMDYFSDRLRDEMEEWDVAIPHPASGEPRPDVLRPDLSFPLRARESGDVVEGGFRVTKGRNRVAVPNDAQIGLDPDQLSAGQKERKDGVRRGDKAFCAQRTRPLLLVHVFTTDETMKDMKLKGPVVTLSFCLPTTAKPTSERSYQVNAVYRKQVEEAFAREDEDDDDAVQAGEI